MEPLNFDLKMTELFNAGGYFGYKRARRHPSTLSSLHSSRNGNDIIDLDKTASQIKIAYEVLRAVKGSGKKVMFVGSKPEARESVKTAAGSLDMPFVEKRFVGGTLTNFPEIKKRLDVMIDLNKKQADDDLTYKTKKELLMIEREITRLNETFGGLKEYQTIPAILVVVDPRRESIAVTEAIKRRIPVIALSNTDCDISKITYPIVMNDANKKAIEIVINLLKEALTI